ncbi:MAG: hypothetical protein HOF98_04650 [Gammaproteobacteria bacterium]|jgi:phosphogluconate dehydratase|nr:hypothetical protein [Gammaproteobacteria bacterium]
MHPVVEDVTQKIIERSRVVRNLYLKHIDKAAEQGPHRSTLGCGNLSHGFAACNTGDKADLASDKKANIAIISSYNDMLSAHEPYKDSPAGTITGG